MRKGVTKRTKTFPFNKTYMDAKLEKPKVLKIKLPNDVAKQQLEQEEDLEETISYYEKRRVEEMEDNLDREQ